MASKMVLNLTNAMALRGIANFSRSVNYGNSRFRTHLMYKMFNVSRLTKLNQKRILKSIPQRNLRQLKCPKMVYPGNFIDKGCSAAIVGVTNREYESEIILKQPFKFGSQYSETESKYLRKLQNHPNIIQFMGECQTPICQDPIFFSSCPDVDHDGVTNSLVLERMDTNLENCLATTDLSLHDRIDILSQILEAEVHMRKISICHRDLKPSNILVKYGLNKSILKNPARILIKVADFDCALDLKSNKNDKIYPGGTPARISPEVLKVIKENKDLNVDVYKKSDIWSIGLMGYEIFKGCNPFDKVQVNDYTLEDLEDIPSTPNVIQRLIKTLLNPDPNLRYHSCVASDILQLFRLQSLVPEKLANLFKEMSFDMIIGCCYLHQLYFTADRFSRDPKRLYFALNFINEEQI